MLFGSQNGREAPKGRFPFFVLILALFSSPLAHSQELEGRVWLDALNYLSSRGANSELDLLRYEALKKRPDDMDLVEAFSENLVGRKDRTQLNAYIQSLADANLCRDKTTYPKQCAVLKSIWNERLSGLLFYESSAPRWEKARRALDKGDCRLAQAELKEIEVREGVFPDLLSKKVLVARCLGEVQTAASLTLELEKLRF